MKGLFSIFEDGILPYSQVGELLTESLSDDSLLFIRSLTKPSPSPRSVLATMN